MLLNTWYVAGVSEDVKDTPKQVKLLSNDFVLFRDEAGTLHCLSDICIHRGASLCWSGYKGLRGMSVPRLALSG